MPHGTPLKLYAIVFDCRNPRELAEFYRNLLGWEIDEAESADHWVELADPVGSVVVAFQRDTEHEPSTWPGGQRPQMAHLDIRVSTVEEGRELAKRVGATPLPQPPDRSDALFRVYADPAGHPFCLCAESNGAESN